MRTDLISLVSTEDRVRLFADVPFQFTKDTGAPPFPSIFANKFSILELLRFVGLAQKHLLLNIFWALIDDTVNTSLRRRWSLKGIVTVPFYRAFNSWSFVITLDDRHDASIEKRWTLFLLLVIVVLFGKMQKTSRNRSCFDNPGRVFWRYIYQHSESFLETRQGSIANKSGISSNYRSSWWSLK